MPRERRTPVQPTLLPTNSLLASGARYEGEVERIYRPVQDWQREAYRHYTICGEARFAARFFGHALSRSVLHVAKRGSNGKLTRQTSGVAKGYLDDLFAGGQSQMLEAVGVHLIVAGECFIVGRKINGADTWEIVSCLEMKVTGMGSRWSIDYGDGKPPIELTKSDVVIRVWVSDPAKRIEADSPFKSLLPVLDEVEWATRHIFSQLSSRLAGAGLLLLPTEAVFPPPPPRQGETQSNTTTDEITGIMRSLADAMLIPLSDPSSPAAKVPLVAKMPGEHIDKVKLLRFWSDVDANAMAIRSDGIRRFFLGMDLPPEQMSGMSSSAGTGGGRSTGVSHWGAWQIEEQTIKMHIEPMADVLANALVLYYLAPLVSDPNIVIEADTSALRLRPDRSKEALELNDRGLVKDEVALRENGFGPEDQMDDREIERWLLRKIAVGSATPEMVIAANRLLGVDLPVPQAPALPPGQTPNEVRPAPSLGEHPTRPRTPLESGLLPACEALVLRALERAGNRIRQDIKRTGTEPRQAPAFSVHTVHTVNGTADRYLEDAWSTAPMILTGVTDNVPAVVQAMDDYCRSLFAARSEHSRDSLVRFLEAAC